MKPTRFNIYFRKKKDSVLLWFFLTITFSLAGSNSLFPQNIEHLKIAKVQEEGLTNDHVVCINQDGNGFLWFGTKEGLFRYDGYSFKAFKNLPGDTVTSKSNVINTLLPQGNKLWIGSLGGLNSIDINSLAIKNFPSPAPLQVYAVLPEGEKKLWVGTTTGLYLFDKITSGWQRVAAISEKVFVTSLCYDHQGNLYVTSQNGFYRYSAATGRIKFYNPELPVFPVFPAKGKSHQDIIYTRSLLGHDGSLWFSAWDAGLVRFDPKTEKVKYWSHQTADVRLAPFKDAYDLSLDDFGNIWVANLDGGLTIYNPVNNKFVNYPVDWKSEVDLSSSVTSLFRDNKGTFWIGTESGIYKYDPHNVHLYKTNLLTRNGDALSQFSGSPLDILKDKDGLYWMCMYQGLFAFDPKSGLLREFNRKIGIPANFQVFNILQDKQGVFWLNERNLLVKFTKKTEGRQVTKADIFQCADIKSNIYTLFIDNEQRIWIGTHSDGFFRFDARERKFISYGYKEKNSRSKINEIRTFCELSSDSLLIGGENTGLILLHTNNGSYEKVQWPGLKNNAGSVSINQIYKSGTNVWIGTEYNGLWQSDRQLRQPVVYSLNDGLPSVNIASIMSDKKNNLWLLTDAGVAELQLPDKKITVFDKKNGIQNLSQLYSIITDDNNVLIGGRGALYSINPGKIIENTIPPKVLITDLRVFDQDFHIQNGEKIRLNYNQNYFSFEYVALNYTQSRLNRYAYKMEGLDKKWNLAGTRRYVSYANLEEGTYVFEVKACNNKGVWNNIPAKLTLVIAPPFWHRLWFYVVILLLISSIIYTVYSYNMAQLKMRLELRDKIARDLHDDIGSTLSGINIFSKIALQKINSGQEGGTELLEKISDRSAKTMDALSDIVWSINTRNDGIDNFIRKAREYTAEMLEPKGIAYSFNAEPDMEHLKIGMIIRKELYLIFKETIYNAAKYSKATSVQICFFRLKNRLTLTIQDDGAGFNVKEVSSGNGIYNMKQRAKKINADFRIESKENQGTMISLSFHIPRFR
jgi:ligand-binding sensor domain-containing protein/two-component sensor histidine kinase